VQLELCWRAYMHEAPPYRWHDARAAQISPLLRRMVQTLLDWQP
jgi:N-formylglutamate deformylase